jgi:predicted TIM-barrel fold metal-dependent hydrolase
VQGKIAIEEHFVTPSLEHLISAIGWDKAVWRRVVDRLEDTEGFRLDEMDRLGIEKAVLSLGAIGVQDEPDTGRAIAAASEANDELARIIARRPDRYAGFAALPLQDPAAAGAELERAVRQLGLKGALVNGYSSIGNLETGAYYDEPQYLPFWEKVAALNVPFYLHPRQPLPNQRRIYQGRDELLGPVWGFTVETATHALRLITSGLLDRFPNLTIIIGHMGELLPFAIHRMEQRIKNIPLGLKRRPTQYLQENFYVTTSGNNHTPSLIGTILQLGADRVIFAADYPFEEMHEGPEWLDTVPISEADRQKIGRTNAQRLLGL